ncbi:hypothetical protein [Sphingobacterium multivorum]|uniref:hypothetical protein n=1 Tax=Sphingobacterium multivorum TaxID=28454 RepID=UPI003DA690A0
MKSKQEVIQEAWVSAIGIERYESIKDELVLDGFLHFQPSSLKETDSKIIDGLSFYRPKSLRGIENNNGWTRIGSEADLLNIIGNYEHVFIMGIDGEIGIGFTIVLNDKVSRKYWLENATHYQPIIKPEAPIY